MAFDILKNSRRITAQVTGSGDDAQVITGSVDNSYAGTAEVLILPELGSEWFLADTTKPLKPVIVQKRKEPVLTPLDREDDDNVFMRKEFIYGTDCRGEAFMSFPHLIFGSFPE
jgi:phage major head subunit gpT-like protein